jgi:hypothetical protein
MCAAPSTPDPGYKIRKPVRTRCNILGIRKLITSLTGLAPIRHYERKIRSPKTSWVWLPVEYKLDTSSKESDVPRGYDDSAM